MEVYRKERRSVALQFEAVNLTNRVNVINFASLFFRHDRCATAKCGRAI